MPTGTYGGVRGQITGHSGYLPTRFKVPVSKASMNLNNHKLKTKAINS
jgi:hypothetical protein